MRGFTALAACFLFILPAFGQWQSQMSGTDVQLRGVSAISDRVAWASGAKGTVLRTIDGGEHWAKVNVPGAEALDFRDVQAFDADKAFVLSIGPGEQSRIYKTIDGGKNWQLQFTNKDSKAFYDCFAFWDSKHGIAVSDSVDGKFPLIATSDGATWNPVPVKSMPAALPNEGAFAASGTCIATFGKKDVWFGTGGPAARVFHSSDRGEHWTAAETPIMHGEPSQGIFSIAFWTAKKGVAIGGDYKTPDGAIMTAAFSEDGGKTWKRASHPPSAYCSGVAIAPDSRAVFLMAVGTNGAFSSFDRGDTWRPADPRGPLGYNYAYNAASYADLAHGWAVGPNGLIVRMPAFVID
jgi:photosystem II stability/assembly factor-like uncharacterized protein